MPPADPPRRSYDATRRRAAAEQRRERVLDAAGRLFASEGWSSTTVAKVAAAAEVSPELVQSAFGTKAGLLLAVVQRVVERWHDGVEDLGQRLGVGAADDLDDRFSAVVDDACAILPVLSPLAAAVDQAADRDPQARAFVAGAKAWHAATSAAVVDLLAPVGAPPDAVDEVYVLLLIESYRALVDERGWSTERYAAWLHRSLRTAVGHRARTPS